MGRKQRANLTTEDILGERFLDRFSVFIRKTPTCWLWTAGVDAYGYGQIARSGGRSPIKAHRAAWMLKHGPITPDQHVLHRCDVTRCVNPDHLFLGDQAANMKDAAAKGRLSGPRPNARRLSAEGEAVILQTYAEHGGRLPSGMRHVLARQLDVSAAYVTVIGRGLRRRPSATRPPVVSVPLSAGSLGATPAELTSPVARNSVHS